MYIIPSSFEEEDVRLNKTATHCQQAFPSCLVCFSPFFISLVLHLHHSACYPFLGRKKLTGKNYQLGFMLNMTVSKAELKEKKEVSAYECVT